MLSLNLPPYAPKVIEKNGKRLIFDPIRLKYIRLTPEEWVRQHFVHYLINSKGYPAGFVGNEITIHLNRTTKRCDTVVYNSFLKPLMILEYKAPHVTINQAVFEQIARYNRVLQVRYLIVSNGLEHICCKIDFEKQSYSFLSDIPHYTELNSPDF
ncbi:type I restriction enzyme HsdR N-terminal domain-containing protein [Parabacteroides sp. PF5-9]|uniref:type I restriction enzyme HsdR N-terminal domain-containing protein n=1 Tax=Parabacteroides sp. PF5-9 TaxID=1742404 RepID=UPI0024769599|nr:type I restriction enzyme HsdR N-terminal domain-containing protein [Parabacteroides sp. PF5-9]MDH6358307.1 putative type IV restriction endonuclease [Parabacteroides sp. PF5-9]